MPILHECRYCETPVSPRASQCPKCGEPEPAELKGMTPFRLIKLLGIALILLSLVNAALGNPFTLNPMICGLIIIVAMRLLLVRPKEIKR